MEDITALGEVVEYALNANPGDVVTVTLNKVSGDPTFDPQWELFGPNGSPVPLTGSGIGPCSLQCKTEPLPVGGVYTLKVNDSGNDATGKYSLELTGSGSVRSDFDRDCDVDQDDLDAMESCASGPGIPTAAGCEAMDLDHDGDIDQTDLGTVQRCYSGENVPSDPACDNSPPTITNPSVSGPLIWNAGTVITISCTATDIDGTVESVTVDLSPIGGYYMWLTRAAGSNTWSWVGEVTPPSIGAMTCTFTATDNLGAARTASVSVQVNDAPPPIITNPSVSGPLLQNTTTAITVSCTATPGVGRAVQSVTVDLSAVGGSNAQALTRVAANTWSWSGAATPSSVGTKTCIFTATDNMGKTGTASASATVGQRMALIPAGEFQMGDQSVPFDGGTTERPVHAVYVDAFYMDRTEVTNQQYAEALNWANWQGGLIYVFNGIVYRYNTSNPYCETRMGNTYGTSQIVYDGTFGVVPGRESQPMVTVSWYGAVAYANWRSAMEGKPLSYDLSPFPPTCNWGSGYRLPTEAEWEKAARGGAVAHRFPWSDSDYIQHARANYASFPDYWYDNSPTRGYHPMFQGLGYPYTSPVAYFAANGYGLYDMAGNVHEWCNDWQSNTYYSTPEASQPNPRGPATSPNSYRVLRDSNWQSVAVGCRSASRSGDIPGRLSWLYGFRLVRPSQ